MTGGQLTGKKSVSGPIEASASVIVKRARSSKSSPGCQSGNARRRQQTVQSSGLSGGGGQCGHDLDSREQGEAGGGPFGLWPLAFGLCGGGCTARTQGPVRWVCRSLSARCVRDG